MSVRDRAIAMAAERNGVRPERLRFLQDNRDQVTNEGSGYEVDEYVPKSTALDVMRGAPGKQRQDPLARPAEIEDGPLVTTKTYTTGDGLTLTSRQMSMERLKSYIPPAEPWLGGVPVLGTGRPGNARVDAALLDAAYGPTPPEGTADESRAMVVTSPDGQTRDVVTYAAGRPSVMERTVRDQQGLIVKHEIVGRSDEALDAALGVTRTPQSDDEWIEHGKQAGLDIERRGTQWLLNGKRVSKKKLLHTCRSPLAMVASKELALASGKYEPYEGYHELHGHYYDPAEGVIQRDTPELYERGGLAEELFEGATHE